MSPLSLTRSGVVALAALTSFARVAGADSFYTVEPCRAVDTRAGSPVQLNTPTIFIIGGLCNVPLFASSVSFNVTLVPGNPVDLGMTGGDDPAPATNVVSSQSSAIASNAVIPLSVDYQGTVQALATNSSLMTGSTDLLLDVNGYFLPDSDGGLAQVYAQGGDNDPGNVPDPLQDPQPPNTLGQTPSGFGTQTPSVPGSPTLVYPLKMDRTTKRHFNYNGTLTPLIGVSADAACHLHLGNHYDMCTFEQHAHANYQKVIADAKAKGLNKIQLWVNINGGNFTFPGSCVPALPNSMDQPFGYHLPGTNGYPAAPVDGIGFWNLDERNPQFFANLQTVVNFATSRQMFVEITFFAPWAGTWEFSPWNPRHGRLLSDSTHATPVGFTDRSYFDKCDGACSNATSPNEQLRQYQMKVIEWTLDALDAPPSAINSGLPFDRIYFEIANEPENGNPAPLTPKCPGYSTAMTSLASDVLPWQQMMIAHVHSYEARYVTPSGSLGDYHLIGVQPFTQAGADPYLASGSDVSVLNGHYTTISARAAGGAPADGAMTMAIHYAGQGNIIIAANEDKISGDTTVDTSPLFGWGGNAGGSNGETCGWTANTRKYDPNHPSGLFTGMPGVDCYGESDSARAQAWEFMLHLGAAYDHYGYYFDSDSGKAIRLQLGRLQQFLQGLPLRQLKTSPDPMNGSGATWVSIGTSPYASPTVNTSKYWGALEPTSAASTHTYVLYMHHSVSRPAPNQFLAFGGYLPLIYTTTPPYAPAAHYGPEHFTICLASLSSGHYSVQWFDPATMNPVSSAALIPGNTPCGTSLAASPKYAYDLLLTITQAP